VRERIRRRIRDNASPRHVPQQIVAVADMPRTISGKISELAVRAVVHGLPVENRDALANPQALELYRGLPELTTDPLLMLRWLIASLHLLALPLGSAPCGRVTARSAPCWTPTVCRRVLFADNLWGLAALLWIGHGSAAGVRNRAAGLRRHDPALTLARISRIQAGLIVLIVFAAAALARGLFF